MKTNRKRHYLGVNLAAQNWQEMAGDLYKTHLRSVLRQAFIRCWPGPSHARRKIAVVGMPRSGTSWLAKVISLAGGVSYYFEPDYCLDKSYIYKYLAAHDEDVFLRDYIEKVFQGRITDPYVLAEQGLSEMLMHPFSHTVLAKFVHLPLALDWVAQNFPELIVIQIIRHPVPLFFSWQQRSWDPCFDLNRLLAQGRLMNGPLDSYAETIEGAKGYWEKAGAFWGALVRMQFEQHQSRWHMFEHEWFCYDPLARFRELFSVLGLKWNASVEKFLTGNDRPHHVSGPGYGQWRDPHMEIWKWKNNISGRELSELWSVIEKYELPCYRNLDITPEQTACPGFGSKWKQ